MTVQQMDYLFIKWNLLMYAINLVFSVIKCQATNSRSMHGIYVKALDDFECPSDEIESTHLGILSALLCFHDCSLKENCQGFFYHQGDFRCILCNERYKQTNALQTFAGTKYFRPIESTCAEWSIFKNVTSGTLTIDVDPDGFDTQFTKITVPCDLDSEPGKAITIMHHDKEARGHVNGYEDCHSYRVTLTYDIGIEAVKKIIEASTACKQYVKYECLNSEIFYSQGTCTGWENRLLTLSSYFTGDGSSTTYCDCASAGTCDDPYGCQCNHNDDVWRFDDGYVTNKDHLPITAFTAGDTGSAHEEGYYTVGPLLCW